MKCDATCGAAFKVNSIGSASGAIGTTFTWGEGAIDDELAEAVCDMAKSWTAQIIQDARGST